MAKHKSTGRKVVDLSPGFRSAAEMAGWDAEALLMAACGEETQLRTPNRSAIERKREARTPGQALTPASANRVRRKPRLPEPGREAVIIIDDSEDENMGEGDMFKVHGKNLTEVLKHTGSADRIKEKAASSPSHKSTMSDLQDEQDKALEPSKTKESRTPKEKSSAKAPCMEKLREELACAVCLDICYEPSTTSCGHSFCRSCLRSAIRTCGLRCPKCRETLKKEGALNVVLWNTIQILFPEEIAKRMENEKAKTVETSPAPRRSVHAVSSRHVDRNRPIGRPILRAPARVLGSSLSSEVRRREQEEADAVLAARLQEEEFIRAPSVQSDTWRSSRNQADRRIVNRLVAAAANLRSMGSRTTSRDRNSRHAT